MAKSATLSKHQSAAADLFDIQTARAFLLGPRDSLVQAGKNLDQTCDGRAGCCKLGHFIRVSALESERRASSGRPGRCSFREVCSPARSCSIAEISPEI
eukprot:scaffold61642_cov87-Phaeocystis_antarctica.AAC.2